MAKFDKVIASMMPVVLVHAIRELWIRRSWLFGGKKLAEESLRGDPLAYTSPFALSAAVGKLKSKPRLLLSSHETRSVITLARFDGLTKKFGLNSVEGDIVPDAIHGALDHNRSALSHSVDMTRPEWIVYPLMGIEQIRNRCKSANALSVGPRSEYELFTLMSIGFRPENVYGLDLFSYSPMIKVGDMHDMPYDDTFFDVIVLGWVYSYSANWPQLTSEVLRCARDRAIIAISADYGVPGDKTDSPDGKKTHVQNADTILKSFNGHVRKVYFRQDADPPEVSSSMVLFEISKQRMDYTEEVAV